MFLDLYWAICSWKFVHIHICFVWPKSGIRSLFVCIFFSFEVERVWQWFRAAWRQAICMSNIPICPKNTNFSTSFSICQSLSNMQIWIRNWEGGYERNCKNWFPKHANWWVAQTFVGRYTDLFPQNPRFNCSNFPILTRPQ